MFHRNTCAADICSRIVSVAYPELAIDEAARVMREHHVGCLVVVEAVSEEERHVVGMLTDRDIAMGVVADAHDAQTLRIGDLMSRDVVSVREQDTVLDALALMRQKGVRRVPVVGVQGLLIGILAIDDILAILAEEMQALAAAIAAAQRHEQAIHR
ncbi:MAG: CBS domain-containing protein [Comamonadaceae bacterium]|jgi:CBS domain-containing protein|nr:CBS domain-containing protein [Comamonadaceae bacterium]